MRPATAVQQQQQTAALISPPQSSRGMLLLLLLRCYLVSSLLRPSGAHDHPSSGAKEKLKERWGVEHIVRDMDHVKDDLKSIMDLADKKELTYKEMAFYLIRMHDFDDNGKLDGIEIRVLGTHSMEHHEQGDLGPEHLHTRITHLIDDVLRSDSNNDGFIDYAEFLVLVDRTPPDSGH